jgi:dolichol-phosphate mannosyltransferase
VPSSETSAAAAGLWVVLPTYDEAGNVEPVTEAIGAAVPGAHVLIVDDNSPDGTGEIADRLAAENADVSVLHREAKEGLGPAYIAGFRVALEAGAEYVAEIDADFSHDPADLARLLAAAEAGADLAIGSRYVPGGGVEDWGAVRRAISRGGSAYARSFLGVDVQDLTGGFKVFRRRVLEALDLDDVEARGYAFQVELTYRALQLGFHVTEVPIVFRDRQVGKSKMSKAIIAEAAWSVPRMRMRRSRRPPP